MVLKSNVQLSHAGGEPTGLSLLKLSAKKKLLKFEGPEKQFGGRRPRIKCTWHYRCKSGGYWRLLCNGYGCLSEAIHQYLREWLWKNSSGETRLGADKVAP